MKAILFSLLAATSLAQFDYTSCPSCLDDPSKKYCIGAISVCCKLKDRETRGCDDKDPAITCSNSLKRKEKLGVVNHPKSDEPSFYRYHICPQNHEVCGQTQEFWLETPQSRAIATNEGIDLSATIPPGQVCTYTVNIAQDGLDKNLSLFKNLGLFAKSDWMTEFLIEDVHTHSDRFKAHAVVIDRVSTEPAFVDIDIMAEDCDPLTNNCIHNVQDKGRNIFISEKLSENQRVEQVYLVLVNSAWD